MNTLLICPCGEPGTLSTHCLIRVGVKAVLVHYHPLPKTEL